MAKINIARIDRLAPAAEDLTLAIEFFETYCRSRNLSPNTIAYYGYCLLAFRRFLDSKYPAQDRTI